MQQLCEKVVVTEKLLQYVCLRKCIKDHIENLHSLIHGNGGHLSDVAIVCVCPPHPGLFLSDNRTVISALFIKL